MGKGNKGGENTKKAAGNAKKAEAAAKKQEAADAKIASQEDELWAQGSKAKNQKKQADEEKKEEARRKKAERDAELEAEMAENSKKKPLVKQKKAGNKPVRSSGGLDAALKNTDLNAHNIDDAISALEITSGSTSDKLDRHPERRFKPALKAYTERRLPELRQEHPGLRKQQYENLIYEEFKKSDENPFNQVNVAYDATRDEVHNTLNSVKASKEERLKH